MSVQRITAIITTAVVVAAVVAALFVVGSPAEQRLLRFDEQRVNDLRRFSFAAENRWDRDRSLPTTAEELVDGQFLSRLPTDPVTRRPYEYRVTAPREFEVCAVFDRTSPADLAGDFWFHDAGNHCFAFEMTERNSR